MFFDLVNVVCIDEKHCKCKSFLAYSKIMSPKIINGFIHIMMIFPEANPKATHWRI